MPENREIEIRSDEVQEILSHVPNWMIRWGISLIFGLILMLVFISWFIKYPDVITGDTSLTTEHPPIRLVNKSGGYVEQLYFSDNVSIKKGQTIAQITNPTNKETIDNLNTLLEGLNLDKIEEQLPQLENLGILGEIQSEFNNLLHNLKEYREFTHDNYYKHTFKNIEQQLKYNKDLASITREQRTLLQQEVNNSKVKYKSDSILYHKRVIAKHEFFDNQSEYISKQQQLINIKKAYIQHKITVADYSKQKNDLKKANDDTRRTLITNIQVSINSIKSYTESWQQNYTFVAPIDGQLSYLKPVFTKQYVEAQEPLFAIVPNNQEYIAYVQISTQGYGKIKAGQQVKIKIDNYPYQEYGQLVGEVNTISQIAGKQGYFVEVKLMEGLTSNYNKVLDYKPEMMGSAEIITDDLRLLERIFNQVRKVLDK